MWDVSILDIFIKISKIETSLYSLTENNNCTWKSL